MPIRFYTQKRQSEDSELTDTLAKAFEGFAAGRKAKQEQEKSAFERDKDTIGLFKVLEETNKLRQEQEDASLARQLIFGMTQGKQQGQQQPPAIQPNITIPSYSGGGQPQFLTQQQQAIQQQPQIGQQPSSQSPSGFIPKSVKFGGQEFANPAFSQYELEQDRLKESQKSLSGETAIRYGGGKQASRNIQSIIGSLGMTRNETGKINVPSDYSLRVLGSKAAGFREPRLFGIPVTGGLLKGAVQGIGAGSTGRSLQLQFDTLAENILRARTGAAAPEPEQVREMSRTLVRLFDDPNIALERLQTNEGLMRDIVESIRPGEYKTAKIPGTGGKIMEDANGNQAIVYPDGRYEEI